MMLMLLTVFVLGALTILAVEAAGVVYLIRWLNRKVGREVDKAKSYESLSSPDDFDLSFYEKQGIVWVLGSEKIPKALPGDKASKQQKGKKEIFEVTPAKKYAKIVDRSLILTESDGSHTEFPLNDCLIAAVSASNLSSRKWAKRYPIKVESSSSTLYDGSRILYIYLETSWEKEAWCKALRIASCQDKQKLKWFAKLNIEFQNYLTSLNAGYPSFMKPYSSVGADLVDSSSKFADSSSKVRQFLKKLAKKASKSAPENKGSCSSTSGHEERKISDKAHSFQDLGLANGVVKLAPTINPLDISAEDGVSPSSSINSSGSRSQSHMSVTAGADYGDKGFCDEGTLCWNLLISRLFFDAKRNEQMKTSLQARIQRMLANMRIPSYIGEVICTAVNVGNLPPYIHAMRVLASDMNEVWAFEIDVQYSGGAFLDIETRLEVQDPDLHEEGEPSMDSSAFDDVKSDLLEGFEHFGKQFKQSGENVDEMDQREEGDPTQGEVSNGMRSSNSMPSVLPPVSKWKSMLHSVAKQVSQVPISLGIRVASLRGTMRLYIKPPPSDQIWFGFKTMPDIDFQLDSSVGEHKISSGRLSLFLINRFKAAIRETLVLPNCESVCIPGMVAEKDDWVPQKIAPYIFINHEATGHNTNRQEAHNSEPGVSTRVAEGDRGSTGGNVDSKYENPKRVGWATQQSKSFDPHASLSVPTHQPSPNRGSTTSNAKIKHDKPKKVGWSTLQSKSLDPHASLSVPLGQLSTNNQPSEELKAPLLKQEEHQDSRVRSTEENKECKSPSRSLVPFEEQNQITENDDTIPKRIGRRDRMLGLGKKMGEKLEEKKRHIEERGRNLVEKMRGQQ